MLTLTEVDKQYKNAKEKIIAEKIIGSIPKRRTKISQARKHKLLKYADY